MNINRLTNKASRYALRQTRSLFRSLITFLAYDWGSEKRQKVKPKQNSRGGSDERIQSDRVIFKMLDKDPDNRTVTVVTNMSDMRTQKMMNNWSNWNMSGGPFSAADNNVEFSFKLDEDSDWDQATERLLSESVAYDR